MNIKTFLKYVLPISLGAFFIYLSISITTPDERKIIIQSVKTADLRYVFLGLFFAISSHFSRAYRWRFLLSPMGYHPRLMNSFLCVLIAYLANMGVPRSGEVIRASFISTYEDIPFEKAFGSIVTERIVDAIMLFIIILIALFLQFNTVSNFILGQNINFFQLIFFGVSIIFLFVLIFIYVKNSKSIYSSKIKLFFNGLWEGMISIKSMKNKFPFILHTIFIWIMYLLMFYVIKWSIPGTFNLTIQMIIPVFVVGGLSIATTNGGIGIFPLSIALVLNAYEINTEIGLAFGWIMWTSQTLLIILSGIISLIALPMVNRKQYL